MRDRRAAGLLVIIVMLITTTSKMNGRYAVAYLATLLVGFVVIGVLWLIARRSQ